MLAVKRDTQTSPAFRRRSRFQVGDRVITCNCRLGTVVRTDRDELGEYVVVRLDILPGEFAYDPWDVEKV
ncbi:Hypothetical protein DEACI_1899 [Acididesulfobacillus acetoxydans]|uniref:Uncharacterized protein n=1 Tax=Acididesulfobacillus acetoxydans TaxID=1561005 RepID=A0A8S0Y2V4_9FIRM|nr:hypothetical protein [Acididesulfobacillus acetoxydans]CAA7601245.1 Hypothetical protein DEACI_1899 [Acididesulfobacillus acetoxydans]CEJ08476.1 Hypothetical protein DEACI_2953 [Acididesulfobacillus acetoxydans]